MLAPIGALAAQFSYRTDKSYTYIGVTGEIESNDDDAFLTYTRNLSGKDVVIVLDSPGGNAVAGLNIGLQIHMMEWSTIVFSGGTCASACGMIWLAGTTRYSGQHAHIGFHAVYDSRDERPSSAGNAVAGAYLRDLGLGFNTIAWLINLPADKMERLTEDKASKYGIVAYTLKN